MTATQNVGIFSDRTTPCSVLIYASMSLEENKQRNIIRIDVTSNEFRQTFPRNVADFSLPVLCGASPQLFDIISSTMISTTSTPAFINNVIASFDPQPPNSTSSPSARFIDPAHTIILDSSRISLGCNSKLGSLIRTPNTVHVDLTGFTDKRCIIFGWEHTIYKVNNKPCLFIPTYTEASTFWGTVVYTPTIQNNVCYNKHMTMSSNGKYLRLVFPQQTVPCANVHLYPMDTVTDVPRDTTHCGLNGSVAVDKTSGRRVAFVDVGIQTIVLVCGCFVADRAHFRSAINLPFSIMEALCLTTSVEFTDDPSSNGRNVLVTVHTPQNRNPIQRFVIDPFDRHEHQLTMWVPMTRAI